MSKKRISPDEQTNEGSDSVFQQDDNAKRAKLTSPSDTTLQDLPIELIECILVKAVAMEVKGMKLAKSVWKDKTDLVISRLTTVCSQWSSILTTDFFRNELHRALDGTAQETIRLEILHQSPLQSYVSSITTLKDEIFLLGKPYRKDHSISVYDRNNMAEVKDVIPLRGLRPESLAACNVSNCVYILNRTIYDHFSILRISRVDEHWSIVSPLTSDICLPHPTLCVTANGSLILSRKQNIQYAAISVCEVNGSMKHEIRSPPDISSILNIIAKSNGNLVLVSNNHHASRPKLVEIDMAGIIIRQYQSARYIFPCITSHADSYGRMLTGDHFNGMELLDSEFNLMDFTQLGGGQPIAPFILHYNSERNEIVATVFDRNFPNGCLTIFHLKEI